jgi:hypothetical protein
MVSNSYTYQTVSGQGVIVAVEADCPYGTRVLSGGADTSSDEAYVKGSGPKPGAQAWLGRFEVNPENSQGDSVTFSVYGICASVNG